MLILNRLISVSFIFKQIYILVYNIALILLWFAAHLECSAMYKKAAPINIDYRLNIVIDFWSTGGLKSTINKLLIILSLIHFWMQTGVSHSISVFIIMVCVPS